MTDASFHPYALRGGRTDLAAEEIPDGGGELPGVTSRTEDRSGFRVTEVRVLNEEGSAAIHKPRGRYVTVDLERFYERQEDSFTQAVQVLAGCLRRLLGRVDGCVLVAGLGNPDITPDAVGPVSAASVLATRHLKKQLPDDFAAFRPVCVCRAGVLGTTGIESAELIRAVSRTVSPAAILVIDALASREPDKLCRTVQMTDSGIVPGSGVGNDRAELSQRVFGVPVIAVGVPTVMDVGDGLIVTPRNIDQFIHDSGRLIGYAINLALHSGLTIADVDMFVG